MINVADANDAVGCWNDVDNGKGGVMASALRANAVPFTPTVLACGSTSVGVGAESSAKSTQTISVNNTV
jgi:hypothetical protein